MKLCKRCNTLKSEDEFYLVKDGKYTYLQSYCKICVNVASIEWRNNNRERVRQKEHERWLANPNRRKRKLETDRLWRERNREQFNAITAKCKLKRKNRVPEWASNEDIKNFYINCPIEYEVDHIIPLNGKNVCGLHIEDNLQYLTKEENRKKGNKFID